MQTEKVIVQKYNPNWRREYEKIKKELKAVLGDLAVGIEHVGSTAVEGMSAKPIIDIDIIINDCGVICDVIDKLENIGYKHEGDLGIEGREAFTYGNKPEYMTHHLYVCSIDSKELHRHLVFRDFLKNNRAASEKYSRIKEEAADLFPDNIEKYMEYKSSCIEELYRELFIDIS